MPLVLASSSAIRRAMLEAAGVEHEAVPAGIDESAAKASNDDPEALALELAGAKAAAVSATRPADWVIGSDSLVSVDGRLFDKPADRAQAAEHLRLFSGRAMRLTSAVALARGGAVEWSQCDGATLHVRELSDAFIAGYLTSEWPAVSHCVGVFRIEGPGVQLFERIEGDHFTIQGMPLLPLLGALRERGVIPS
ncbi:MAG TPA: nucleoside triphosphate pyrophosphatase [Sphingomicrobium sp.]|nr:nucleoside triphosphate pyrophosphatase [Sphingomicrobium sp.]